MDPFFFEPHHAQTLVFKPASLSVAWHEALTSIENNKTHQVFRRSKSALHWIDMPNKILEIPRTFSLILNSEGMGVLLEEIIRCFKKIFWIIKVWASGFLLCHEEGVLSLSHSQVSWINASGFLATFVFFLKSSTDINKNFRKVIFSEPDQLNFKFGLLILVKKICSCVMCLFGLLGMILSETALSQWIFLGISTFSLSLSISKYYYKRLFNTN